MHICQKTEAHMMTWQLKGIWGSGSLDQKCDDVAVERGWEF